MNLAVIDSNTAAKFQAIQQLCSTNDDLENERNSILRPTSIEPVFTELLSATKDIHVGWLLSHAGKNTCRHLSLALDKHEPGWEDLAAELGISLKLIMDIRYNESNLREGPTYTILCIYAYKKGATIGKLLEALRTIRRDDLLCILKECVIGENGLIEQLRAEAERWNKDDYINNELNSTSSDVISFFSTPSLPPLPIKYEEFSTSELLKTRNFSENIVERRVCSERMVTRAITKSEKNDVMVKKPKKKTRYKAIVMLTFSVDGFSHAETITSVLREKNIGVLILNEHRDRLVSNPELFITELFPQVNYIIPIVTKGYLDALTAASFTEGPLTSCADALYVKLIYTLMANQFVRDGCINLKVRCIVPDGSEWLMQQHPVVRNRLVLQAWLPQREIDVLADSIISTSGARSEE